MKNQKLALALVFVSTGCSFMALSTTMETLWLKQTLFIISVIQFAVSLLFFASILLNKYNKKNG